MEPGVGMHIKPATGGATSGGESDNGSGMASPGTSSMDELSNDAEGIWSADIEQSFQEALAIYPPCGRRKIILSDEGKMYGRNELIARYIKLRTGKTRTRKQVSSHIQVLSRRKAKDGQPQTKDHSNKDAMLQNMSSLSPTPVAAPGLIKPLNTLQQLPTLPPLQQMAVVGPGGAMPDGPHGFSPNAIYTAPTTGHPGLLWNPTAAAADAPAYYTGFTPEKPLILLPNPEVTPPWRDRSIAGPMLRLVELSAFVERQPDDLFSRHLFVHIGNNVTYADPLLESVDIRQIADKFPDKNGGLRELYEKGPQSAFFLVKFWADINTDITDEMGSFYAVTNVFESSLDLRIECSTKLCSFGKQVVEKIESTSSQKEGGRHLYKFERGQMCEYLVNFIHKLKHLPQKYMMNSVLENFTILQVVVNHETRETLLCIAYVFEVSSSEHGAQYHIYRLMKD